MYASEMLCVLNDYNFVVMYLKIDFSMDGLDVSESSRVMTFGVSIMTIGYGTVVCP